MTVTSTGTRKACLSGFDESNAEVKLAKKNDQRHYYMKAKKDAKKKLEE